MYVLKKKLNNMLMCSLKHSRIYGFKLFEVRNKLLNPSNQFYAWKASLSDPILILFIYETQISQLPCQKKVLFAITTTLACKKGKRPENCNKYKTFSPSPSSLLFRVVFPAKTDLHLAISEHRRGEGGGE